MNTVSVVQIASRETVPSSEFSEGLITVDHHTQGDLALPAQAALISADISDTQQLQRLFPLSSISNYPIDQLRPSALDPGIFSAAAFRDSLSVWQQDLQEIALQHRQHARKFGRLARLLAEQDALFRLAQMYASALVQG